MNAKLIGLLAILLGANIVAAQSLTTAALEHGAQSKSTMYSMTTASRDSVTKSQAKAARMDIVVDNFEKIDANNDGIVTRNELRAYALSMRRHVPLT
ncbi:MAG TPA: hypothetical protein VN114_11045 [Oxalicibacterium sp.]|uniref:hypothetical protein n=1 Tax=Oxalicibacterium sp. TaxID=2766525 RepID=UPI002CD98EBF|nr:hypothetical protein [Oxalicibacterium sp.]HWU99040.1 hypothetical protein [Oxalicibacterium sp.]